MNARVKSVHEKKKPFKCDICEYSCSQMSRLNLDLELVHGEKKLFKCDICDYSFFQKCT